MDQAAPIANQPADVSDKWPGHTYAPPGAPLPPQRGWPGPGRDIYAAPAPAYYPPGPPPHPYYYQQYPYPHQPHGGWHYPPGWDASAHAHAGPWPRRHDASGPGFYHQAPSHVPAAPVYDKDHSTPHRAAVRADAAPPRAPSPPSANKADVSPSGIPPCMPGAPINTIRGGQVITCGPEGCNLFVFHLPNNMTNLDLYNLFAPYGNLVSVSIMVDRDTGRSRGFGFVSYDTPSAAVTAIRQLDGFRIANKRLKVQHKRRKGGAAEIVSPSLPTTEAHSDEPERRKGGAVAAGEGVEQGEGPGLGTTPTEAEAGARGDEESEEEERTAPHDVGGLSDEMLNLKLNDGV